MTVYNTLYIFGDSHCLPFALENKKQGWDSLLSNRLTSDLKNFSQPGADNLFIFSTFMQNQSEITKGDAIVIGWSHPSRKTFILDQDKITELEDHSMVYTTPSGQFARSKGVPKHIDTLEKWLGMSPVDSGVDFYDNWYKNYYSLIEQKTNLTGYLNAVKHKLQGKDYIPFYFSEDSIDQIENTDKDMCIAEFIQKHDVSLSKDNGHMNTLGHMMWADKIYKDLKNA
jgi:lysophospholipase L1-like esterase